MLYDTYIFILQLAGTIAAPPFFLILHEKLVLVRRAIRVHGLCELSYEKGKITCLTHHRTLVN
jgi:hypothetical protein